MLDEKYRCRIFDLCLAVPFPVGKELRAPDEMPVDIHVEFGQAPLNLPNTMHRYTFEDTGVTVQVDSHGNVLMPSAAARYYVAGGHTVLVDADPSIEQSALRNIVLYYCLPALLNQRGAFALHANAICTPHGVILSLVALAEGSPRFMPFCSGVAWPCSQTI